MGQMYIEEAFKRLNLLEDDYSYSEDQQLELLNSFVSDDIDDIPEEEIIDVEAETCDDLQDNYIGKVIIECDCCHTRLYKDQEDLILGSSEDGVELFNVDEECPVCHTTSGYRVIGKIEQYSNDAHKEEDAEQEETLTESDVVTGKDIDNLTDKLHDLGFEMDSADKVQPQEEVTLYDKSGKKYKATFNKYSDGGVEILNIVPFEEDDDFEEEVHEALKEALDGDRCVAVLNKNEFDETGDAEAIAAKIESDYIPGNGELETLNIECEAQGDNIIFTGSKIDIDELYNRMFPEGITPDYVECSLDESVDTVEFNSKEDAKKYYDEHRNELQDYKSFEDWFESGVEKLDEALNSVEVKTDEGNVIVEKTDDKLVVDLSSDDDLDVDEEDPDLVNLDTNGDEMIAPLSNEEEDDILNTAELNAEEKDEESEEESDDLETAEDVDDFEEEEPEDEDTDLPDLDEVEEEETEEDEEEVEESLHESLSDRLKARLASMSSKGGDEEDDEPLDEELTRSEKMKAVLQYLIDRPDKKQYSDDDIRQAYKEYEEKKNASKKSHDEDDHEDDDEQLDESLKDLLMAKLDAMLPEGETWDDVIRFDNAQQAMIDKAKEMSDRENPPSNEDDEDSDVDEDLEIDDLEDFNESTFNKICESYLRRVYENVNGFKCTRVKSSSGKLMVEGVINFVSGNSKQTTFEFSKPTVTKRGKVVLEGLNKTFTNTQNAYILKGYVKDKEFISESMIYRYTAKTINESNQQESVKFYGRVVCK